MSQDNFDLNLLRVFEAVLKTRSTTLAADSLSLTQSAVSNALKRLRHQFNDPIFVKTSAGMVPTAIGEQLAVPLLSALSTIRQSVAATRHFDPSQANRIFTLYCSDTAQRVFIPRLLSHLRTHAPLIQLRTVQLALHEARQLMASGDVDLTLGFFLSFEAGFYRQKLFTDRYQLMVSSQHPIRRARNKLKHYLQARHIAYRPTVGSHQYMETHIDKFFAEHDTHRHIVMHAAHGLGLTEMVRDTDLIVAIPNSLAQACAQDPGIAFIDPPFDSPALDITQQWHERFHADPGHTWLRQTVAQLFQRAPNELSR